MTINVVYRGPLERSRLGFLLEAAAAAFGSVRLVWLYPMAMTRVKVEALSAFVGLLPIDVEYEFVDGRYVSSVGAYRALRTVLRDEAPLMAVGFDSLHFVQGTRATRLVWCVNGIPEESELGGRNRSVSRLANWAGWTAIRAGRRPDLAITVSEPMSRYVREHIDVPCFAAPNCVDRRVFFSKGDGIRNAYAYLGTGAPWQCVDRTAAVWRAIAKLDADARFLVVSRDERCRALVDAVPAGRAQMVGRYDPNEVNALLQEAAVGFLLREPWLVNRVSYPTKLGEYVAAGARVVLTALDWDPTRLVEDSRCGTSVPVAADAREIAQLAIALRHTPESDSATGPGAAAAALARQRWVEVLSQRLRENGERAG